MTQVRLIRHGTAEARSARHASDGARALTPYGASQAAALAAALDDAAAAQIVAVIASPAVRCIETVTPLAERLRQRVAVDHRLAEGSSASTVLALAAEHRGDVVLCSHGDVIGEVVLHLISIGLVGPGEAGWATASTWILDVDNGVVQSAHYQDSN